MDSDITPAVLTQLLNSGSAIQLVDVREEDEWSEGHLDGCTLIPLGELRTRMTSLEPGMVTVVYCHSGARSAFAAAMLRAAGFRQVHNLLGGMVAWEEMQQAVNVSEQQNHAIKENS